MVYCRETLADLLYQLSTERNDRPCRNELGQKLWPPSYLITGFSNAVQHSLRNCGMCMPFSSFYTSQRLKLMRFELCFIDCRVIAFIFNIGLGKWRNTERQKLRSSLLRTNLTALNKLHSMHLHAFMNLFMYCMLSYTVTFVAWGKMSAMRIHLCCVTTSTKVFVFLTVKIVTLVSLLFYLWYQSPCACPQGCSGANKASFEILHKYLHRHANN